MYNGPTACIIIITTSACLETYYLLFVCVCVYNCVVEFKENIDWKIGLVSGKLNIN